MRNTIGNYKPPLYDVLAVMNGSIIGVEYRTSPQPRILISSFGTYKRFTDSSRELVGGQKNADTYISPKKTLH
jgi:hypothetical protein